MRATELARMGAGSTLRCVTLQTSDTRVWDNSLFCSVACRHLEGNEREGVRGCYLYWGSARNETH